MDPYVEKNFIDAFCVISIMHKLLLAIEGHLPMAMQFHLVSPKEWPGIWHYVPKRFNLQMEVLKRTTLHITTGQCASLSSS